MSKVSFVIYFHSSRVSNLLQTIKCLEVREPTLYQSEIILVCHDACPSVSSNYFQIKSHSLNLPSYNKAKLCNFGVNQAENNIVALLDSDRILPANYFFDCSSILATKQFITTRFLYNLNRYYSDGVIISGNVDKFPDFRSMLNEPGKKNLFSGNTVFFKKDYLDAGGMDEGFEGYGYCDNDMTENILSKKYKAIYLDREELHLYHKKEVFFNNRKMDDFKILSAINAKKYFRKWKLTIDYSSETLIHYVRENLNLFDPDLINKFRESDAIKFL